jgi:hypothetical protein
MSDLNDRLNKILDRVTSEEFLSGRGLGNEIPFYAFDYPPKDELAVREHVAFLLAQIPKKRPDLRIKHINLLELIVAHMRERNFYDKAIQHQKDKGDDGLLKVLKAPLDATKIAKVFVKEAELDQHDMVFVTGVGSAYPMLRTHSLLNNLHTFMGSTPLVLFYPGVYDGLFLRLFGELKDKPYYRAFRLVD